MTVLVTGAAGFVGSQVVRRLLASNQEVAALVRPRNPRPRLKGLEEDIRIFEADVSDTANIEYSLPPVLYSYKPSDANIS